MPSIHTLAVHAGERTPAPAETPVTTPIYHSVGYLEPSAAAMEAVFAGEQAGYVYRRYESPTVDAFERAVAVLEGGEAAFATASGMAAVHAALLAAGVRAGSAVVAAQDCYGATYSLLSTLMAEQGVAVAFVDVTDLTQVRAALAQHRPAALLVETISNPLLKLADIAALAEIAHSASKYIGGHGDVLAGVVVTALANRQRLFTLEKLLGAVLAPEVAWLALRGLKTLPLRMEPAVARVHYPGLPSHPQHDLAARLLGDRGYGGMIAFELRNATQTAAFHFLDALKLILPATTLGDVYSLALYPVMASHRAVPPAERARLGISDGLLRLSIGIEDVADIVADLAQALGAVSGGR